MDTGQFLNRNALKVALVVLMGVAVLAMISGAGYSYADSPKFCGTFCHAMDSAYATYLESNHKQFKCTDCHLPHDSLVTTLMAKAIDGVGHTYHEALRTYPATVKISAKGKTTVQDNCMRCHASTVENTFMASGEFNCTRCHRSLVHSIDQSKGGIRYE